MPIPFLVAGAMAVLGAVGVGAAIKGGVDMKDARDMIERAKSRADEADRKYKKHSKKATKVMDDLGEEEIEIVASLQDFKHIYDKIKNKPMRIVEIDKEQINLGEFLHEVDEASIGASALLGGLGSAAVGTAGSFAAAGAANAAVAALATASTGTAISSLSGAAAVNATLAVLGGGTLAAGGGGVALGTAVLGTATAGIGFLVGGLVFSLIGSSQLDKAESIRDQSYEIEKNADHICEYLSDLAETALEYHRSIKECREIYVYYYNKLKTLFDECGGNIDYNAVSGKDRQVINITTNLTMIIYQMCKVKIVKAKEKDDFGLDKVVNHDDIEKSKEDNRHKLDEISYYRYQVLERF